MCSEKQEPDKRMESVYVILTGNAGACNVSLKSFMLNKYCIGQGCAQSQRFFI